MSNELKAVVTADIKEFMSGMNRIGLGASSAALAVLSAFAAVGATVLAVSKESINAAKSFETLRVRLQLLAGDMAEGAKEFDMIRKRAKESSFETDKMIDAYVRLRATAGKGFATRNLDNIGYAAKVAGEDMATMASRVGELAIRIESGLGGALLKKSLRTFATAIGRDGVLSLNKLVDDGAEANVILKQLEFHLDRFGKAGKEAFENTAEGLEDRLGGVIKDIFAGVGEGDMTSGLDGYKKILKELINVFNELESQEHFRQLAENIGMLMNEIVDIVKTEGFKDFLIATIELVTLLTGAVMALVGALRRLITLRDTVFAGFTSASNFIEGRGAATATGRSVDRSIAEKAAFDARFGGGKSIRPIRVINVDALGNYVFQ